MSDQASAFSNEPNLVVEEYRPVSVIAIAALIVGLLSFVGMFNPYLLIVPLVGVILGAIALLNLQRKASRYSGIWAAALGLTLASFFLFWGGSYAATRSARLYTQAEDHVQFWFALIQEGKRYEAFELMLRHESRKVEGANLAAVYGDSGEELSMEEFQKMQGISTEGDTSVTQLPDIARAEFKKFFSDEPGESLKNYGKQGTLQLLRNETIEDDDFVDRISQIYRFRFTDEGGRERRIDFRVKMERWAYPGTDRFQWNIARVEKLKASESS